MTWFSISASGGELTESTTASSCLQSRNERHDANAAFAITDDLLDRFLAMFEEPTGEGEVLVDQDLLDPE